MAWQALRGTTDLLADELRPWSHLEHTVRRLARLYGYQEIRTPILEDAGLLLRSVGETSNLVQKEMFRFPDRGGQDIVLRPEGTAPVVRAYLERHLHKTQGLAKLVYLGPMFRAERPQAGRFRQFHQYGVEVIGSPSPWVDVEVLTLCMDLLRALGVTKTSLWVASMGCRADQRRSAEALRARLQPQRDRLCEECRKRFDKNVFRVLDCRHPTCHALAWAGNTSPFLLCDECRAHFDTIRQGLRSADIPFDETKTFARGLDYYTRTVFEVRAEGLGAQDAVAAGGRYDHLVEELGGPSVGACGFAAGIERVLIAAGAAAPPQAAPRHGVYLAVADGALLAEAFRLARQLRAQRIPVLHDLDTGRSLKAQLREADKTGARFVAIVGPQELERRAITVKDLEAQGAEQTTIPLEHFAEQLAQRLGGPAACRAS